MKTKFPKVRAVVTAITSAAQFIAALAVTAQPSYAAPDSKERPILIAKKEKKAKAGAARLKWYRSYNEAATVAKESKKWILIDVYTEWCQWCAKLDQTVYSDPKLKAFLDKNFVCVKADAEKGDGITIKEKYGIEGYPCTIVLAPNGKSKGRIYGYIKPKDFPMRMAEILQSPKEFVLYL